MLGYMYLKGEVGLPKSDTRFFGQEQDTAKHGGPAARYNLALAFCNGYGTISDRDACRFWLRAAAEGELQEARDALKSVENLF